MHTNNNTKTNYDNANPSGSCPAVPILYIEESVKRYYDVKKKVKSENGGTRMRISKKKYYDIDWRFYMIYRFGNYIVCGTRCPMYDYYNDKWPVVSVSFTSAYDAYDYIMLLIGQNKVNLTLYVSRLGGCVTDLSFAQPTGDRFRELDDERSIRRNELTGYDRMSPPAKYSPSEGTISKMMSVLASAAHGNSIVPFISSRCTSSRETEWCSTCRCYNTDESNENCDMDDNAGAAEPTTVADTNAEDNEHGQDDYPADYEQRDDYYDFVAWDHATNSADTR
jgi:hypothetical protein